MCTFCARSVHILYKICVHSEQDLSTFCTRSVYILFKICVHSVQDLCAFCTRSVWILNKICVHSVQDLSIFCTISVHILYKICVLYILHKIYVPTFYTRSVYNRLVHKTKIFSNNFQTKLICCSLGSITPKKNFKVQLDQEIKAHATPLLFSYF